MTNSQQRDTRISKSLSKLLRHQAVAEGLQISNSGQILLSDVLSHNFLKSNHATFEDIVRIVTNNEKQRFKLEEKDDGQWYISASQGHSIQQVNHLTHGMIELDKMNDSHWPEMIVHGTYKHILEEIKNSGGLSKMGRNHIHFTYTIPRKFYNVLNMNTPVDITTDDSNYLNSQDPVVSGVRGNCQVLIFLNISKLRKSDLKFYKSDNNVILSPGDENGFIPLYFIDKVVDYQSGIVHFP
jgi:2'-phosphotransferase